MLAGNVHVLVNDAILLVVGDELDNQVEISQNASVDFVVGGTDTTINRRSEPLVINDFVYHVTIALKDGNDTALVSDVAVRSKFQFLRRAG